MVRFGVFTFPVLLIATQAQAEVAQEAAPNEIRLQNRSPLAFLLVTPSGNIAKTTSSDIIARVSELVEKHTDFKLTVVQPELVADCQGRFGCFILQVRNDYDRSRYALDSSLPFQDHKDHIARKKIIYPALLLVLSNLELGESDQLTVTLIDTDAALEQIHKTLAETDQEKRDEEADLGITENAVVGKPISRELQDEAGTFTFLQEVFTQNLRRRFTDSGHWEPYAEVEIKTPTGGHGIILDGTTVGTTNAGLTKITNVRAGKHEMTMEHPEFEPFLTTFTLERGKTVHLEPAFEAKASPFNTTLRTTLFWSGIALAGVGTVLTSIELLRSDGGVTTYCSEGDNCKPGSRWRTLGYDSDAAPTFEDKVNGGSVLAAPLFYSIALTGGTWALGTAFIGEDDDLPWIQLVAGIGVGVLAYGLSAALDKPNPFP